MTTADHPQTGTSPERNQPQRQTLAL